jgi:lipid-binding SYLF domain-containing protein
MTARQACAVSFVLLMTFFVGCQTTPPTQARRDDLAQDAQALLERFETEDPSIRDVVHRAYGYAIFPNAGKAALVVGGAYGRGVVHEQGRMIGYADITQATIGAQVGGQRFAELIVFESADALTRFKNNQLSFAANASAVAIEKGAGATARYENGVIVFVEPRKGAMLEASVGGQKFTYVPADNATAATTQPREVTIERTETRETTR